MDECKFDFRRSHDLDATATSRRPHVVGGLPSETETGLHALVVMLTLYYI